jgi:hypothetical protein
VRGVNATEGAPMNAQIGTYTGMGYFVPTDFYRQLVAAMKQHDEIFFDSDYVTLIKFNQWPSKGDFDRAIARSKSPLARPGARACALGGRTRNPITSGSVAKGLGHRYLGIRGWCMQHWMATRWP